MSFYHVEGDFNKNEDITLISMFLHFFLIFSHQNDQLRLILKQYSKPTIYWNSQTIVTIDGKFISANAILLAFTQHYLVQYIYTFSISVTEEPYFLFCFVCPIINNTGHYTHIHIHVHPSFNFSVLVPPFFQISFQK